MGKWFDEDMTYREIREKLFSLLNDKTDDEMAQIKEEYLKIMSVITDRELKENDGCFADD